MHSRFLCCCLLLLIGCHSSVEPPAAATSDYLTALPDPKSLGQTYVSDPDHVLQPTTVVQLNEQLRMLDQSGRAHLDVVLATSIGQAVPKTAATALFNRWKVGAKGQDNGLLMLLVLDQHRIEIETGYGLEGDVPDALCFRIEQKMLPLARAHQYDAAVTTGVQALVALLNRTATSENVAGGELASGPDQAADVSSKGEEVGLTFAGFISFALVVLIWWNVVSVPRRSLWVLALGLLPLGLAFTVAGLHLPAAPGTVLALCYLLPLGYLHWEILGINRRYWALPAARSRPLRYQQLRKEHRHLAFGAFVFPVGLAFYWLWHRRRLQQLREAPYACPKCRQAMLRLDEQADDAFLASGQVAEEQMHSVDYDVWQCPACAQTLTLPFPALSPTAKACPQCKYKTLLDADSTVEKEATTRASGWGWRKSCCANCHHEEQKKYTIARIRKPSSSGTFSSSSSDSSSSADSYSSSDGGSSGGGGAGSSW